MESNSHPLRLSSEQPKELPSESSPASSGPRVDRCARDIAALMNPNDLVLSLSPLTAPLAVKVAALANVRALFVERQDHSASGRSDVVPGGPLPVAPVDAARRVAKSAARVLALLRARVDSLSLLDDVLLASGHTRADVCVIFDKHEELPEVLDQLVAVGLLPWLHLGVGGALLCVPRTTLESPTAQVDTMGLPPRLAPAYAMALARQLENLQHLQRAHDERSAALLDELLVHHRRIEAELFDLRLGSPVSVRSKAAATDVHSTPTVLRKARKLLRDPRSFVKDSKNPVLRVVGAYLR